MLPWMRKGKEGNDEKEIHSMDIDSINIIFGTGSRCDGKNKFKETSWCAGKWSRWPGGTFLGISAGSGCLKKRKKKMFS